MTNKRDNLHQMDLKNEIYYTEDTPANMYSKRCPCYSY